jgi:ADP-heptose:LPS heptosyltransferase
MKRGSKKNRLLDLWVGIPLLNLLATFHRRHTLPKDIRRVGLVCSAALGDTLLFSAAVQDLRSVFVDQKLIHFCAPQNLAAAELIPGIDQRVAIDLTKPVYTIRQMRRQKLDLLIDYSAWQRLTALYTFLSGARFTAGFRTPRQYRHRGYDHTAKHRRDRHELENFRTLTRSLGYDASSWPRLQLPKVVAPEVLKRDKEIIVFHLWPSGVNSWMREWPGERWIELAHSLATPETLFVLTGGPGDRSRSTEFAEAMRAAGLNAEIFVSPDGFASLCQLLLHSELLVSVNTGIMHLAATLGTPTVSINGPTANHRWGPIGQRAIGVDTPDGGGGYLHLGFEFKGQPTDSMERISVNHVLQAVHTLMAQNASASVLPG